MRELSLLDTADRATVQWHVVYCNRTWDHWWTRRLKPGFQHVFLAKPIPYGPELRDVMWLKVDPCAPFTYADVHFEPTPPWVQDHSMTVQRVTAARPLHKVRQAFAFGPPTCVESAKAYLGINRFWLRTPWQLYQYLAARDGVIT